MIFVFKSYDEPLALMSLDPLESKCICVATNKVLQCLWYDAKGNFTSLSREVSSNKLCGFFMSLLCLEPICRITALCSKTSGYVQSCD